MNTIPNPDNWMDVFTILVATAMVAIPSWLAARNHKSLKKVSEDTTRLDKSISNGHTTPLRLDVDEIRDTLGFIRTDLHSMKSDLHDLRTELRDERKDRIDLDDRFERFKKSS